MNRPTPQQFAACVLQVSAAFPGQDIAFAPHAPESGLLSFAQMWRCDVLPVCDELDALVRLDRVGLRLREAIAADLAARRAGAHA